MRSIGTDDAVRQNPFNSSFTLRVTLYVRRWFGLMENGELQSAATFILHFFFFLKRVFTLNSSDNPVLDVVLDPNSS